MLHDLVDRHIQARVLRGRKHDPVDIPDRRRILLIPAQGCVPKCSTSEVVREPRPVNSDPHRMVGAERLLRIVGVGLQPCLYRQCVRDPGLHSDRLRAIHAELFLEHTRHVCTPQQVTLLIQALHRRPDTRGRSLDAGLEFQFSVSPVRLLLIHLLKHALIFFCCFRDPLRVCAYVYLSIAHPSGQILVVTLHRRDPLVSVLRPTGPVRTVVDISQEVPVRLKHTVRVELHAHLATINHVALVVIEDNPDISHVRCRSVLEPKVVVQVSGTDIGAVTAAAIFNAVV